MSKLRVGPEGFVDLRRNPPPDRDVVNGWTPEPPKVAVPIVHVPEPPPAPPLNGDVPLPAIQKDSEGLAVSVAQPVKVAAVGAKRPSLMRIYASDGHPCYVVVTRGQHTRLAKHKWSGTRSGRLFRKVKVHGVESVVWLHREACRCNKADKFVAQLDGDERNCTTSNLKVCDTAEEAKACRRNAIRNA